MDKGIEIRIPKKYCCPISGDIMAEPVCTMDGQTYDRKYIEEWLFKNKKDTSPATNKALTSKKIIPNWSLNSIISEYVENNHQFQDEYDKQKDISKLWHLERKKYLPLGNIKAFGAIEYPALPQKLFDILYKKINETVNLLNYYRDLNQDYFISWLVESYKLYTIETESFVKDIDRKEELELFLENNQAFYYLAKDFDVQEIVLLTTKKTLKWLNAIRDLTSVASKFQKSISLKTRLKQLGLPLRQVEQWEDNSKSFKLLAYLLVFSVHSNKLVENGNFSLQNERSLDALEQINLLKNEKGVDYFFEKIFSNFCESFLQLIAKDEASIPWYKWVDLWKEDQFNENKEKKIFEQILDVEKNGEHPKFSTFIRKIKVNWFKNDSDLITHFHKYVSLKSLFVYYRSSSENEKRNILDDTRSDTVYEYLSNKKITPSQALQWFFDPELKPKIPPLYVTQMYGTEPIVSFKNRLEEFKDYKEKQNINSTEIKKTAIYSNKHNLKRKNSTKKYSTKKEGCNNKYPNHNHTSYQSLYSRNNTRHNAPSIGYQIQTIKKNNAFTAATICNCIVCIIGCISGIGGETYHLLSQYRVSNSNKPLVISLLAISAMFLFIGFLIQQMAKNPPNKYNCCSLNRFSNITLFVGIISVAGSAISLYFDANKFNLILFLAASVLMISSVIIKTIIHNTPPENQHLTDKSTMVLD